MKRLWLILFFIIFNLLNAQLVKICDGPFCLPNETIRICDSGICLPDETIRICDSGICLPDEKLFVTTYEVYNALLKNNNNSRTRTIRICGSGICLPDKTIRICDSGICLPDRTIQITNNIQEATIVLFVTVDILNNFSSFPGYKTLLKNYLSQTNVSNNTQSTKSGNGFKTKIDDDDDNILKLANGAIVEISYGYLGYLGYLKDCIVYKSGSQWKIWIEGKKTFSCTILKEPSYLSKIDIEEVTISEISDNGNLIFLTNGSVYEVSFQSYETMLWLGFFSSALIINRSQIINLDEGSELIDVYKIK